MFSSGGGRVEAKAPVSAGFWLGTAESVCHDRHPARARSAASAPVAGRADRWSGYDASTTWGISRQRRVRGLSLAATDGERVTDPETLERIRGLATPVLPGQGLSRPDRRRPKRPGMRGGIASSPAVGRRAIGRA